MSAFATPFSHDGVIFRPLAPGDLEWARQLHNDPHVLSMLTDPREVSPAAQQAWYERLQGSTTSFRIVAAAADTPQTPLGLARIDQLDWHNRSVCVGFDMDAPFRGRGHAPAVYAGLLAHIFGDLQLQRAWLLVASYNERAKRLYQRLHFRQEGVQRSALFRFGAFHDYIMMSILKTEWEATHAA